jgi:hypothetical protein
MSPSSAISVKNERSADKPKVKARRSCGGETNAPIKAVFPTELSPQAAPQAAANDFGGGCRTPGRPAVF